MQQHKGGDLWSIHKENKRKLLEFVKQRMVCCLPTKSLYCWASPVARCPYKRSDLSSVTVPKLIRCSAPENCRSSSPAKPTHRMTAGSKSWRTFWPLTREYPNSGSSYGELRHDDPVRCSCEAVMFGSTIRVVRRKPVASGMKAAMNGVLNLSIPRWLVARSLPAWKERMADWRWLRKHQRKKLDAHDQKALVQVRYC